MKDKLLLILSLIIVISLSSCSKETVIEEETTTSISLATPQATINLGESYTFTITDNNGKSIRSGLTIYVNSIPVSGLTFKPSTEGSYAVYAKYKGISSNTLNLMVTKLPATSITITASKNPLSIGQAVDFIVKDNYGGDVTSQSTIFIDNASITGASFTPTQKGSIEVYATFEQLETAKQNLSIYKYAQKVLIEDYTGTWCGWCPRVLNAIELVLEESHNVIPVGIHCGDDPFDFSDKSVLLSAFGISGFPSAKINRTETWAYPENSVNGVNQVLDKLQEEAPLGIGISSSTNGSELSITVDIDFQEELSDLKLIVYILEDNLHASQANYTSLYDGLPNLVNFEHDHVLRHCITDLLGNSIASVESVAGNTYQTSFNFDLSSSDVSNNANVKIVAFVVNGISKTAINAQEAAINETVTF